MELFVLIKFGESWNPSFFVYHCLFINLTYCDLTRDILWLTTRGDAVSTRKRSPLPSCSSFTAFIFTPFGHLLHFPFFSCQQYRKPHVLPIKAYLVLITATQKWINHECRSYGTLVLALSQLPCHWTTSHFLVAVTSCDFFAGLEIMWIYGSQDRAQPCRNAQITHVLSCDLQ